MKQFLMMCVMLAAVGVVCAEQTGGTIFFRDGRAVPFEMTGTSSKTYEYTLRGYMGSQKVSYVLSDFKELIFSDPTGDYSNAGGPVILVSKSGDRFNLSRCDLVYRYSGSNPCSDGTFHYRYLDPVTKALKTGESRWHAISHIEMGDSSGTLRRNPVTGEFFPSVYNFDPFTGQKLEWANP